MSLRSCVQLGRFFGVLFGVDPNLSFRVAEGTDGSLLSQLHLAVENVPNAQGLILIGSVLVRLPEPISSAFSCRAAHRLFISVAIADAFTLAGSRSRSVTTIGGRIAGS